jgi:xanthine dehydrogenase accessory factor
MQAFARAVNRSEPAALITVVRSTTGAPPPGAKLLLRADGTTLGDLAGPHAADVLADARAALAKGVPETFVYPKPSSRTRRAETAAGFEVYVEVVRPPTLLIVGGGHVGGCVAKLGKFVGFQVAVLDDRPDFANAEKFPDADQIICEDFVPALERFPIDETTYIVVVTRGHKHDEAAVRTVVQSRAAYIGMIGSRRRAGAVMKLIRDSGVPAAVLERVRTPIGLDIGAETPEEIAVSIVGELLAVRLGGTGRPLSEVARVMFAE